MAQYAIEAFEVTGHDDEHRRPEPTSRGIDISWYWDSERSEELWELAVLLANRCRVQLVYWRPSYNSRTGKRELPVVGMPADLDYFDMLFTHLWQQMNKGLEPKPDTDKPMIENLVAMKEAGMKWERIGELLVAAGQLTHYDRNMGVRFTKLYTDYCDEHDRPRLRTSPKTYQRNFAQGFVGALAAKFREERQLANRADRYAPGMDTGSALALRDIKQVATDKAHEMFGRPPSSRSRGGSVDNRKYDPTAHATGREAGRRADTSGVSSKRGVSGPRKELNR
jgi:hypothetical protein